MWPLLFCSLFFVAVVIERLFALRKKLILDESLIATVNDLIKSGDMDAAVDLSRNSNTAIGRIITAGLERRMLTLTEIETAVTSAGSHEATLLNSNLRSLGALANITPMLGLLGTVFGMIKAFTAISLAGTGDPSVVATGISEALITTATGLVIGIPALAMYHFLKGKVERILFEVEEAAILIVRSTIDTRFQNLER